MSVKAVAPARPPMIANAIGPQKTVGAIGIIPRMAADAVQDRPGAVDCSRNHFSQ